MNQYFLSALILFLAGIFAQPIFQISLEISIVILFFAVLGLFWFKPSEKAKKTFGLITLFNIGLLYPHFFTTDIFPQQFIKTKTTYQGIIINAPETKKNYQQAYLKLLQPIQQKVLLRVPKNAQIFYGQQIKFSGVASIPPKFNRFDYAKYLKRHNTSAIVSTKTQPKILHQNQASSFVYWAQKFRQKIQSALQKTLPSDESTVATGMLLGVKKQLSTDAENNFRNAGLTHLLVVSGANVSLIIILVSLALKPFGRPINFIGSVFTILFFIGMTGADPPIVRASLMGGLIALAPLAGRLPDYKIILVLSACLIGLFNPRIIQQDIGFFLSFVATAGIILGSPIFIHVWEKLFGKKLSVLKNILAVTVSAQVFVLPISAYFFQSFPLGGFIANLVAEPIVPIITIGSIFVALFSILPVLIAKILALPIYILIKILFFIAEVFAKIPIMSVSKNTALALIVIEILILLFLLFSRKIEENFYSKDFGLF